MSFEQKPTVATGPYALSEASSFALDLIRTIAAQLVLVGHAISLLGLMPWLQPPQFAYIQNLAVVVFFLLSGLLISYSVLSRAQKPTFQSYLIDRFSRIYSGLVPALIFIAAVDWLIIRAGWEYPYPEGFSLMDFIGNLLMLQDYPGIGTVLGISSFGTGRVLWTLAVEWWLYLLFGWVLLSRRSGPVFWLGLAVLLPVPLYNVVGGRGDGLTAMWILGLGCCLVLRSSLIHRIGGDWRLCLGFALLAAARVYYTKDAYDLLFSAFAAASLTTLIVTLDVRRPQLPRMLTSIVRFAADYSFTLYLVHLTVIAAVLPLTLHLGNWVTLAVLFAAANIVAALLALGTEMRHRQLRHFLKRRFAPQGAVA